MRWAVAVTHYVLSIAFRQLHRSGNFMKKALTKIVQVEDHDMRTVYDFK